LDYNQQVNFHEILGKLDPGTRSIPLDFGNDLEPGAKHSYYNTYMPTFL